MGTVPIKPADFIEKLDQLVGRIWTIQSRISELEEFEKQWEALFLNLKERVGHPVTINILSPTVLRSYHWDRYHILLNDLYSMLHNEVSNDSSLVRQAEFHLKIHSLEEYIDENRKLTFVYVNPALSDEEYEKERTKQVKFDNAKRLREFSIESMRRLYPDIKNDFIVGRKDTENLTKRISKLADEIEHMRHAFAHKYQDKIYKKYQVSLEKFDLKNVRTITQTFFDIVRDIGMVIKQSSYAGNNDRYENETKDAIDLILFGSIGAIHFRFYENCPKDEYYWVAREKYYESNQILSLIPSAIPKVTSEEQ